jgi:hypothetical protein
MAAAPEKLASLRHLLAERFPDVPGAATPFGGLTASRRVFATGIPAVDDIAGGLPLNAITELVCAAPSCGSHLFLGQLLAVSRAARQRAALIDSTDSFDPGSLPEDLFAHLIWVRCSSTAVALQAADLLARDANLGLVVLDLRHAPLADLRGTPATQWYRLQRAVESSDLALVVETPRALVPSAQLRLVLDTSLTTGTLNADRTTLGAQLAPTVQRQRVARDRAAAS